MLEIIALIYLTRRIGNIASDKGASPTRWKWITVLTWIGAEFIGAFITLAITGNMYSGLIAGILCAIMSYLMIEQNLKNKPDIDNNWVQ